jgi:hypothetical protein
VPTSQRGSISAVPISVEATFKAAEEWPFLRDDHPPLLSDSSDLGIRCCRQSFVIYGEPQSGKTEMMICLTAKLLDSRRKFVLHLLNDSVDLLGQNLGRFQESGLAPAAQNYTDILDPAINIKKQPHIVFCKKNARDLQKPK